MLIGSSLAGHSGKGLFPTRKEDQVKNAMALNLLLLWMLIQSLRQ